MNITSLVIPFIFLVLLLGVLIVFLFMAAKKKKMKTHKSNKIKVKSTTLHGLRDKLKNKELGAENLKKTLDSVIQDYGHIEDFELYVDIIFLMTGHPNTSKEIILSFEKDLSKLNPSYASSISKNVMNGLSLR